ncbi:hypothetical protein J1N35_034791 [Gossypium stocksii]|uniref:MULE transposase domain-containing protein n=1 Tax=Gossypium stocksii TaxID=47602 RepID=A0A9D3UT06_9ROSI|nr:hypothetical protein J1N35_034791 [Gossypium stocksii]
MKEKISTKIVKCYRRRTLKLVRNFPVLSDPIKFTDMELVNDEDVETMVALYCQNRSHQIDPIQLFAELANVEPVEDFTSLSEVHEVQDPCMVVFIALIDKRATVRGIDNLNAPPTSESFNSGPRLQIHSMVIEIDANVDYRYDNNDHFDHDVEDFSDLDLDEVPDDIDDEILLISVAQDGNRNLLPIVFSIVDKKNMESWEFYLTNFRTYVVRNVNICIIIDRGKGIIAAIRFFSLLWKSIYCIRHIAANFYRDYKNANWRKQVVKIAYELEPHLLRQRMTRLEGDMQGEMNTPFR